MEKITVSRLGQVKKLEGVSKTTGKPYSFNKIGFQCEEHPDVWYDFTFNQTHNLEVGKEYDLELTSRDYNGKTYWDAKFPKMEDKVDDKLDAILNRLVALSLTLNLIKEYVVPKEKIGSTHPTNDKPEPFSDTDVPF